MSLNDKRRPRRGIIGVIGDGHIGVASPKTELAETLGKRLVDVGYRIVCGGLGGVMEAACRGARTSDSYRPGDTVGVLPGADHDAANPYIDVVLPTNLSHARNSIVAQAEAVVAIGGGAGTLSEMAFAWIMDRLIVGFRVDGWSGQLAGRSLDARRRPVAIEDDRIFGVDTPDEAVAILDEHLDAYRNGLVKNE